MEIIHGNGSNFQNLIQDDLVVVDFFASWCGPCKMLGTVFESMRDERSDFKVVKIDIDDNEELARKFGIMSVPTLMIFKNGTLVSTQNGFMPKEALLDWINDNR